ncbi:Chloroperoxidase, partial [Lentinula aff. lateritia]
HEFIVPTLPRDSQAPYPGLNTLANHGYIPRSGRQIKFIPLVCAIMQVYNMTLPLALLLS